MRRSSRYGASVLSTFLVAFAATLMPATAGATSISPAITGEAASQITPTSATLEATIDPGSAAPGAYYQFQLAEDPGAFAEEIQCPPPPSSGPFLPCIGTESATALPIGHIAHEAGTTTVVLDLAEAGITLKPGTTYHYRVLAASAKASEDTIEWEEPTVLGADQTFMTKACPVTPAATPQRIDSQPGLELAPVRHRRLHRRHHRGKHKWRALHRQAVSSASAVG
jgi:hypothetical protein